LLRAEDGPPGPPAGPRRSRLDDVEEFPTPGGQTDAGQRPDNGRLQRSFNAEIASDRFYFLDKANAFLEAAELLVCRCEEVDRWIAAELQAAEKPR
jgi:hypothetical protein